MHRSFRLLAPAGLLAVHAWLLAAACGCRRESGDADAAPEAAGGKIGEGGAATDAAAEAAAPGLVDLSTIANLARYPGLTDDHRARLARDGFFLAPTKATSLFQVYERNERLGLPGFVTPDLAVDVFAATIASVQRDVLEQFVAPELYECFHAVARAGIPLRALSRHDAPDALEALDRTIAIFAVAAHLLGAEGSGRDATPAPAEGAAGEDGEARALVGRVPETVPLADIPWPELPSSANGMFHEAVSRVRAADGEYATGAVPRLVDFREFLRADPAPPGRPRALARAMIWLEEALGTSEACNPDPKILALAARLLVEARLAPRAGAEGSDPGEPILPRWMRIVRILALLDRRPPGESFDAAVRFFEVQAGSEAGLPRSAAASIRDLETSGREAGGGVCGLLPMRIDQPVPPCAPADRWLGPSSLIGAAGRDLGALGGDVPAGPAGAGERIPAGRAGAWTVALDRELERSRLRVRAACVLPAAGPPLPGDCEPADATTPVGAAAPVGAFDGLLAWLDDVRGSLVGVGVLPEEEIEVPSGPVREAAYGIQETIGAARQFLRVFGEIAAAERAGARLSDDQIEAIARAGTWAETILADAVGADSIAAADGRFVLLDPRTGVLGGLGGVDALYVVIDTPAGRVLARGATFADYEDLAWSPIGAPPDDVPWRAWLDSASPPPRPGRVRPPLADPVPPPPLVGDGVRRCIGPDSAGDLDL